MMPNDVTELDKEQIAKAAKNRLTEFLLTVKKASVDKASGEMRWRADTSDTEDDSYNDNMSAELYQDFIHRIEEKELPPEEFRSEFWQGGEPYVSVSHYPDFNGDAVPGITDAVYVDGKFLKAKGRFFDTKLGKACFASLCRDREQVKSEADNKVRVSIAFIDWKHKHKSDGFVFERKSLDDLCPECFREMLLGESKGKVYLKGHLIHLALTRVPVNTRTIMEVDRSMTTRVEDAASIVGDEIASELEEKAKAELSQKALVTMSDADTEVEKAKKPCEDDKEDETDEEEEKKKKGKEEKKADYQPVLDAIASLSEQIKSLAVPQKAEVVEQPKHVLDGAYAQLKASYSNAMSQEGISTEDKLRLMQDSFNEFGNAIMQSVKPKSDVVESTKNESSADLVNALSQVMQPISQKLDLLAIQLSASVQKQPVQAPIVPQRRSIDPATVRNAVQQKSSSITPKLRELIDRTT